MSDEAQQSPDRDKDSGLATLLRHLLAILIGAATGLVFYGAFRLVVYLFT